MRSSILFVVGLCAVLAFSATAAAQSASLSLSGPESPLTVTAGQSTSAAVDVTFIFDEGGCSQDLSVPVTVTVSASRLTPTPGPAQLSFTIPAGLYSSSAEQLGVHNETQSTTINVPVSSGQSSGFSDTITVTASSPTIPAVNQSATPPEPSGCGPSDIPSAEGSTSFDVQVQPDVIDDGDGDDGGDGGDGDNGGTPPPTNGDDGDDEEDNGVPVAPWVAPLALLGAAIALRTRR